MTRQLPLTTALLVFTPARSPAATPAGTCSPTIPSCTRPVPRSGGAGRPLGGGHAAPPRSREPGARPRVRDRPGRGAAPGGGPAGGRRRPLRGDARARPQPPSRARLHPRRPAPLRPRCARIRRRRLPGQRAAVLPHQRRTRRPAGLLPPGSGAGRPAGRRTAQRRVLPGPYGPAGRADGAHVHLARHGLPGTDHPARRPHRATAAPQPGLVHRRRRAGRWSSAPPGGCCSRWSCGAF